MSAVTDIASCSSHGGGGDEVTLWALVLKLRNVCREMSAGFADVRLDRSGSSHRGRPQSSAISACAQRPPRGPDAVHPAFHEPVLCRTNSQLASTCICRDGCDGHRRMLRSLAADRSVGSLGAVFRSLNRDATDLKRSGDVRGGKEGRSGLCKNAVRRGSQAISVAVWPKSPEGIRRISARSSPGADTPDAASGMSCRRNSSRRALPHMRTARFAPQTRCRSNPAQPSQPGALRRGDSHYWDSRQSSDVPLVIRCGDHYKTASEAEVTSTLPFPPVSAALRVRAKYHVTAA
jgi:hypothetical protein